MGAVPSNSIMKSAREQLGEVITFYIRRRSWPLRRIANACGVSQQTIEDWMHGVEVPSGDAWKALKGTVADDLREHTELRQKAIIEEQAADRQRQDDKRRKLEEPYATSRQQRHDNRPNQATTNLGAKIRDAVVAQPTTPVIAGPIGAPIISIAPTPPKRKYPASPPGSRSRVASLEREDHVRGLLHQRPYAKIGGPDGITMALQKRFGIGLTPERIDQIRDEVLIRMGKPPLRETANVPQVAAAVAGAPSKPSDPASDLQTAVELALAAVPNLKRLVIEVDENGRAEIDYALREVKIVETAGKLTVGGKK